MLLVTLFGITTIQSRSLISVRMYSRRNIFRFYSGRNAEEIYFSCPKSRDLALIESYLELCEPPSSADVQCIEDRQVGHKTQGMFAVTKIKCRHGYPQAFVQYPVGKKISSGMLRLSCPMLVKAIDSIEEVGGVEKYNQIVRESEELKSEFLKINLKWREIRNKATTETDRERILQKLGDADGQKMISSGIIGITPEKVDDVKCLHAHVADTLLRGKQSNPIGAIILRDLENSGINLKGCEGNIHKRIICTTYCHFPYLFIASSVHFFLSQIAVSNATRPLPRRRPNGGMYRRKINRSLGRPEAEGRSCADLRLPKSISI